MVRTSGRSALVARAAGSGRPGRTGPGRRDGRNRARVQHRRAGMVLGGARPEHPVAVAQPVPGDARVVDRAAGGDPPELVEHVAAPRKRGVNHRRPRRLARLRRTSISLRPAAGGTAWSQRSTRPSREVMVPSISPKVVPGSTTVGAGGGLGQERVDDDEVLESCRARPPCGRGRGRHHRVGGQQEHPATDPGPGVGQQLDVGAPLARQGGLVDAPALGDHPPVVGVLDRPPRRELVAALPVLAAALAVALAGEHVDAAAGPTDVAAGERHVEPGPDVAHAGDLLLGAPGVEVHHPVGTGQERPRPPAAGRRARRRWPRPPPGSRARRRPGPRRGRWCGPSRTPRRWRRAGRSPAAARWPPRRRCPGRSASQQSSSATNRPARVDDDHPSAPAAQLGEQRRDDDREGGRQVGADHDGHLGPVQLGQRAGARSTPKVWV